MEQDKDGEKEMDGNTTYLTSHQKDARVPSTDSEHPPTSNGERAPLSTLAEKIDETVDDRLSDRLCSNSYSSYQSVQNSSDGITGSNNPDVNNKPNDNLKSNDPSSNNNRTQNCTDETQPFRPPDTKIGAKSTTNEDNKEGNSGGKEGEEEVSSVKKSNQKRRHADGPSFSAPAPKIKRMKKPGMDSKPDKNTDVYQRQVQKQKEREKASSLNEETDPDNQVDNVTRKKFDNEDDDSSDESESKKLKGARGGLSAVPKVKNMRKNIRDIIGEDKLEEGTLNAQKEEMLRLQRLQEKREAMMAYMDQQEVEKLVSTMGADLEAVAKEAADEEESRVPTQDEMKKEPQFDYTPPPPSEDKDDDKSDEIVLLSEEESEEEEESLFDEMIKIKDEPGDYGEELDDKVKTEKSAGDEKGEDKGEVSDADSDIMILSEHSSDEEEIDDVNNSGAHINDEFNVPDAQGRVLVNVGHPENEEDVFLAPQLATAVKPHQIGGIRFLYDNLIESIEQYKTSNGFGCILAHSMGLGKTMQIVSFSDVLLRNTEAKTILIIVPINTVQNWLSEFNSWLPEQVPAGLPPEVQIEPRKFRVSVLNDSLKNLQARGNVIKEWYRLGGVLLMGYELYRQLSLKKPKKTKKRKKKGEDNQEIVDIEEEDKDKELLEELHQALVKPGPDLVICDEGHRIKNAHANISQALKNIQTKRRVVLTGYPLQNNLMEYWCMVDFVRPNYLGNKQEFANMFERPILNGQCVDSTPQDKKLMRYRAHVLHSLLEGFVQRRGHSVLRKALPPKHEHVVLCRMTEIQRKLYSTFMTELQNNKSIANPLKAFAVCCKIWNHPDILYNFLMKRMSLDYDPDLDEVVGKTPAKGRKGAHVQHFNPNFPNSVPSQPPWTTPLPPTSIGQSPHNPMLPNPNIQGIQNQAPTNMGVPPNLPRYNQNFSSPAPGSFGGISQMSQYSWYNQYHGQNNQSQFPNYNMYNTSYSQQLPPQNMQLPNPQLQPPPAYPNQIPGMDNINMPQNLTHNSQNPNNNSNNHPNSAPNQGHNSLLNQSLMGLQGDGKLPNTSSMMQLPPDNKHSLQHGQDIHHPSMSHMMQPQREPMNRAENSSMIPGMAQQDSHSNHSMNDCLQNPNMRSSLPSHGNSMMPGMHSGIQENTKNLQQLSLQNHQNGMVLDHNSDGMSQDGHITPGHSTPGHITPNPMTPGSMSGPMTPGQCTPSPQTPGSFSGNPQLQTTPTSDPLSNKSANNLMESHSSHLMSGGHIVSQVNNPPDQKPSIETEEKPKIEDCDKSVDEKDVKPKDGEVKIEKEDEEEKKEEKKDEINFDWAEPIMKDYIPGMLKNSSKFQIFFKILENSMSIGDRMLIFSQSLFTLSMLEEFLQRSYIPGTYEGWLKNRSYFRLDGGTSAQERERLINEFNNNPNIRLFLVSTRAGGLGINLAGANRVIVFDASFNPCHDTQAVCRVYRYGQQKQSHIYRLVTDLCLEKRIYDRQINKQGISDRIVDELNPDAHLSSKEIGNLLVDIEDEDNEEDLSDKWEEFTDDVLKEIVKNHSELLTKLPFKHDSLLVDRKDKKLSQAEKRLAKRSYELEKQANIGYTRPSYAAFYPKGAQNISGKMGNIVFKGTQGLRYMTNEPSGMMTRPNILSRSGSGNFPVEALARQGVSVQQITVPKAVSIPTNTGDGKPIQLQAGQSVMVIKTQKGMYLRLGDGKIVAIRVPSGGAAESFGLPLNQGSVTIVPTMTGGRGRNPNMRGQSRRGRPPMSAQYAHKGQMAVRIMRKQVMGRGGKSFQAIAVPVSSSNQTTVLNKSVVITPAKGSRGANRGPKLPQKILSPLSGKSGISVSLIPSTSGSKNSKVNAKISPVVAKESSDKEKLDELSEHEEESKEEVSQKEIPKIAEEESSSKEETNEVNEPVKENKQEEADNTQSETSPAAPTVTQESNDTQAQAIPQEEHQEPQHQMNTQISNTNITTMNEPIKDTGLSPLESMSNLVPRANSDIPNCQGHNFNASNEISGTTYSSASSQPLFQPFLQSLSSTSNNTPNASVPANVHIPENHPTNFSTSYNHDVSSSQASTGPITFPTQSESNSTTNNTPLPSISHITGTQHTTTNPSGADSALSLSNLLGTGVYDQPTDATSVSHASSLDYLNYSLSTGTSAFRRPEFSSTLTPDLQSIISSPQLPSSSLPTPPPAHSNSSVSSGSLQQSSAYSQYAAAYRSPTSAYSYPGQYSYSGQYPGLTPPPPPTPVAHQPSVGQYNNLQPAANPYQTYPAPSSALPPYSPGLSGFGHGPYPPM